MILLHMRVAWCEIDVLRNIFCVFVLQGNHDYVDMIVEKLLKHSMSWKILLPKMLSLPLNYHKYDGRILCQFGTLFYFSLRHSLLVYHVLPKSIIRNKLGKRQNSPLNYLIILSHYRRKDQYWICVLSINTTVNSLINLILIAKFNLRSPWTELSIMIIYNSTWSILIQ